MQGSQKAALLQQIMRVYTNESYIKRRAKIGVIASWLGLAVLAASLFITLQSSPGVFLRYANDPQDLTRMVSGNNNAIGYLNFNDLQQTTNPVTVLPVDGVTPTAETIAAGTYPVADANGAVAVIASAGNPWIGTDGISMAELAQIFATENGEWMDIRASWPNSKINRLTLRKEASSAYDTFVSKVMTPVFGERGETVMLGTINPNYRTMVALSFGGLLIGFIAAQIGGYMKRRFGTSPRPDEQLAKELKGLDDRYTLYSWQLPADYALLGPNGVYAFALREHANQVINEGKRWKHKGSALRFLLAFSNEGIGNPSSDAQLDASKLQDFIKKNLPDTDIEVQPVALFINPDVKLDVKAPVVPVLKADQLKGFLKQRGKELHLNTSTLQQLQTLFEQTKR